MDKDPKYENEQPPSMEDYVSFELAVALKKAGFDWSCDRAYMWPLPTEDTRRCVTDDKPVIGVTDAPSLWRAHKWLRDVKGIAVNVIAHDGGKYHAELIFLPNCTLPEGDDQRYFDTSTPLVETYGRTLADGISNALRVIDPKDNN